MFDGDRRDVKVEDVVRLVSPDVGTIFPLRTTLALSHRLRAFPAAPPNLVKNRLESKIDSMSRLTLVRS